MQAARDTELAELDVLAAIEEDAERRAAEDAAVSSEANHIGKGSGRH